MLNLGLGVAYVPLRGAALFGRRATEDLGWLPGVSGEFAIGVRHVVAVLAMWVVLGAPSLETKRRLARRSGLPRWLYGPAAVAVLRAPYAPACAYAGTIRR